MSIKTKFGTAYVNTQGWIFRVFIKKNKSCKQGWNYCYNYTENGKRKEINSIDIHKLKQKVLDKGLDWIILDNEKASEIL